MVLFFHFSKGFVFKQNAKNTPGATTPGGGGMFFKYSENRHLFTMLEKNAYRKYLALKVLFICQNFAFNSRTRMGVIFDAQDYLN